MVVTVAAGGIVSAQAPAPGSLPALQQSVSQRTAEWNTLATNLEQRIARLLPCDLQARAAIDEVSRASEARSVALTSYWTVASLQSRTQAESIRRLLTQEEGRVGDWVVDTSQARTDIGLTTALGTSLASGVTQIPALVNPQKDLETIGEQYRSLEKQAQDRAAIHAKLVDDLRELLNASQTRQAAIDERVRTVGVEGSRWSAYYAARLARAQSECFVINPAAAAAQAPRPAPAAVPRVSPQGKKQ
jgi:hypothetical protein